MLVLSATNLLTEMMFGWTLVLPKIEEDTSKFMVAEDDVSWLGDYSMVLCE